MVSRKILINIHLYLAALLSPAILMMAVSGGLYLIGVKGSFENQVVYSSASFEINRNNRNIHDEIEELLRTHNIPMNYDYIKRTGNSFQTRPTSRLHYVVKLTGKGVEIVERRPDLIRSLIELHKGHGPVIFKTFQKFLATGLMLILISGLWLGIGASRIRSKTLGLSGIGILLFIIFAFF